MLAVYRAKALVRRTKPTRSLAKGGIESLDERRVNDALDVRFVAQGFYLCRVTVLDSPLHRYDSPRFIAFDDLRITQPCPLQQASPPTPDARYGVAENFAQCRPIGAQAIRDEQQWQASSAPPQTLH